MLFRSDTKLASRGSFGSTGQNFETLNTNFLQCNNIKESNSVPFYFTEIQIINSGFAHVYDKINPEKISIQFFNISLLGDHKEKTEQLQNIQKFENKLITPFKPEQIQNMPKLPSKYSETPENTEIPEITETEISADRKSTRLNSSHSSVSRMPSSA